MKKSKVFLSLLLAIAFVFSFSIPAFAAETATVNKTVPIERLKALYNPVRTAVRTGNDAEDVDPALEAIYSLFESEGVEPELFSDFTQAPIEPVTSSASDFSAMSQSRAARSSSVAYVSTYADLAIAVADSAVSNIYIMANITMTSCLAITRNINFYALGTNVTLTSAPSARHFSITDQNSISLLFNGLILSGNNVSGGISITNSNVTLDGVHIKNCKVNDNVGGGAISAFNNENVDGTIVNSGSLTVNNGTLENNESNALGGAVFSLGQFSMSDSTVKNNTAASGGGGVYVSNLSTGNYTTSISHTLFDSNEAGNCGGGVFFMGTTSEIKTNSEFKNNSALAGGAICSKVASMTISNCSIHDNEIVNLTDADPDIWEFGGAGIYSAGNLTVSNTNIYDNESNVLTGAGGGIFATSAQAAGYAYTGAQNLTVTGCNIQDNSSEYVIQEYVIDEETQGYYDFVGGGVAVLDLDANLMNTTVEGSKARLGGGILHIGKSLTLANCSVSNNTSYSQGGGILSADSCGVTTDVDDYNFSAPDLTIIGGKIQNNYAPVMGGGIAMLGGDVTPSGTVVDGETLTEDVYSSQLTVNFGALIGSDAPSEDETVTPVAGNTSGFGGGIYCENTEMTINGASVIRGNTACGLEGLELGITDYAVAGGGILSYNSKIVIQNGFVTGNVADDNDGTTDSAGGGIYMLNGAFGIYAGSISNNSATIGGGIYFENVYLLTPIGNNVIFGNIPDNVYLTS